MRRAWILAAMGVALVLVTGGCSGGGGAPEDAQVGNNAPEFSLSSANGDEVSLDDYLGHRPVLLYFSMGPG